MNVPIPDPALVRSVLDAHAPLRPAPLCPELQAFYAQSLVEVWEAAERAAGQTLPAPFWAYPWAAGMALARVLLDSAERIRGKTVLDLGCGGGITSIAAAHAGAARVVANDIDPWALETTRQAAAAQGLEVETLLADLTAEPARVDAFEIVVCGDLAYEQSHAPAQLALLRRAAANGAWVLAADAGRKYFEPRGMALFAEFSLRVPKDLEGVEERVARVFEVERTF